MSLLRSRKRSFSIASRRVAVRTHISWYWRGLVLCVVLGVGIALVWWLYGVGGDRGASEQAIVLLTDKVRQLEKENARLQSAQVRIDRRSQIDVEAQKNLERDFKALQVENATLKEQLAFIRGMTSSGRSSAVNIQRFSVKRESPGGYRFRLMLVQAGQKDFVFRGRLQLVVTAHGNAGDRVQVFPGKGAEEEKFKISLKSYQSIDGLFHLAPGLAVKSVEARIFSDGSAQPKLSKSVELS